jgi:hypothetical protein
MKQNYKDQSGNALWFILIAVVLLGALTVTLSRGGSSSDQTGDFEQISIKISQILRYTKSLEEGVRKLQMLNSCSETEINFFDPNVAELAAYERTPDTRDECKLFNVNGAGLAWQPPPSGVNDGSDWIFNGETRICGIDTDRPEVTIILKNMNQKICEQINRRVLSDSTVGLDADGNESTNPFVPPNLEKNPPTEELCTTETSGRPTGCVHDAGDEYVFYHVLIPR